MTFFTSKKLRHSKVKTEQILQTYSTHVVCSVSRSICDWLTRLLVKRSVEVMAISVPQKHHCCWLNSL